MIREADRGGSGLVVRVVRAWLRDAPSRILEARGALESGDGNAAHRAVHSLKSASATVGAARLAERCRTAERAFAAGLLLPDLLDDIEAEHGTAVEALGAIPEMRPELGR